ncbi:MAG: hypothetical protein Kow0042_27640 [Calditrichia bacterium]
MNSDNGDFKTRVFQKIKAGPLFSLNGPRPFVTLTFAQSLDGSISLVPSASVCLSNRDSQIFTHLLRASHDAILVGIGTLIADDPRLTVRLVQGPSPQPIVVDSHLRFPLKARLMRDNEKKPWIASTYNIDWEKEKCLKQSGATILHLPALENGWVNLEKLLANLYEMGIRSVMVEGGARIISSFLRHHLADQMVLTIAPMLLGGFRAVRDMKLSNGYPWKYLKDVQFQKLGDNLLVRGDIIREDE